MSYHKQIVDLVTKECAAGTGHRKVLEPLANMIASVCAGIDAEHGEDILPAIKGQIDKMYAKYREAYEAKEKLH